MLVREFYVVTFDSTHKAIKTEKITKEKLDVELIPTPREISASCGLSLKFKEEHIDQLMYLLKETDKDGMVIYHVERVTEGKLVTPIGWR